MSALSDVEDFHRKFELGYVGPPRLPDDDLRMFRLRFLAEELRELGEALGVRVDTILTPVERVEDLSLGGAPARLERALDALVDLDYVLKGTVSLLGLASVYPEAWRRVHAANLRKERGLKPGRAFSDARWDVRKPAGWVPPRLLDLVGGQPPAPPVD